jgi:small-conductance mechanosensitive channel
MNEFFTIEALSDLMNRLFAWIQTNVLVIDNAVQLAVVGLAFGAAWLMAKRIRPWLETYQAPKGMGRFIRALTPIALAVIWLSLQWLCVLVARQSQWPNQILVIFASLLTAWAVIRFASQIAAKHPSWGKMITWIVWSVAALSILDLLGPAIAMLDSVSITIGGDRISLWDVTKSTLALVVLLSVAVYLTGLIESRIRTSKTLSPSVQVLFSKALKIVLIGLAIIVAIDSVGIDLTALAVFGGAIGLGVGFGLQKIVGNLISGVILLVDKSIKPGDVIAVSGTYGWVTSLGGRYVSVVTRDGVEHLIPNETLISERVENWTHTDNQTRLKLDIGIHYDSDVNKAIDLCVEAANDVDRVLREPAARCLLVGFGDSSIDLQVRFWIADAHNGVQNVKSMVMLNVWNKFKEAGIEIPYPQRDLHVRSGLPMSVVTPSAA